VLVLVGAAMLAGCSKGPIGGRADSAGVYPNVSISSLSLADKVRLNPANVSETEVGLARLTQPIRAAADAGLAIEYRVIWFDRQGRPIEPMMTWRFKRLEPRVREFIEAEASSREAVDYEVQLRWARP
jgi:uncharacterized protein YcfL